MREKLFERLNKILLFSQALPILPFLFTLFRLRFMMPEGMIIHTVIDQFADWVFCCYSKYAALPVGGVDAISSVLWTVSTQKLRYALFGLLHILIGFLIWGFFQVLMRV